MTCEYQKYCGSFFQFGEKACPEEECQLQEAFEIFERIREDINETKVV